MSKNYRTQSLSDFRKKLVNHIRYENEDIAVEIAYMLRKARLIYKLTQSELAKKIGTKQEAIARIERGVSIPSLTTLIKIAEALDTRLIMPIFEFMKDDKDLLVNSNLK